jgi:hypothetical protein
MAHTALLVAADAVCNKSRICRLHQFAAGHVYCYMTESSYSVLEISGLCFVHDTLAQVLEKAKTAHLTRCHFHTLVRTHLSAMTTQ